MRRYLETLKRFWPIVLIPMVVLPIAEYKYLKTQSNSYIATANVFVP